MHDSHGFQFQSLVPGLEHTPHQLVSAILISLIFIGFLWFARFQLRKNGVESQLASPKSQFSFLNLVDFSLSSLFSLAESVMGLHQAKRHFRLIASIFIFILLNNLVGLIPGFLPATDDLNMTLALGLFVFLYYNITGVRESGFAYFKHFLGPILPLAPLMLVIELASHVFRPLSLALRLKGNISGDHIVIGIFSDLLPLVVPVVFMMMGLFVAFVQSFVFSLMTMVYISLAVAHEEH